MRLTTERKVCAGVLSLAMVALAVDRLVLGGASGPATAAGAELLTAAADVDAPSPAASEPRLGLPVGETVAKQLASLSDVPTVTDAFVPPQKWMVAIRNASVEAAAARDAEPTKNTETTSDPVIAKFLKQHQLTAVVGERNNPDRAIIKIAPGDGQGASSKLLLLGDEISGFKLLHLQVDRDMTFAEFQAPGDSREVVRLKIPVVDPAAR